MVSIIIPCHNYGSFVSETLTSVLNQTYQDWECIVVDDGSTDNTREIVENLSTLNPRIKYIYQTNLGVSYARNNGLRNAKGDYIQFLDADDLLISSKIESHLNYLVCNPKVDIVYGPVRYFDDGNFGALRESLDMSLLPWMPYTSGEGHQVLSQLVKSNIMVIQSPLIRKGIFSKTNFFYEALRYNEDWYLWIKCALVGMSFAYHDNMDGLSYVRVHKTSASQNSIRMLIGERKMRYLLMRDLFNYGYNALIEYNMNKIKELDYILGRTYFQEKKLLLGVKLYVESAILTGNYLPNARHIFNHLKANIFKSK
jgi:glycosyltransferase involved in cell wall biosynthesis